MKIGLRKSPHLETLVAGIARCGDTFTSEYDTGADFYLCWGWPQAEQVARDNGGRSADIICIDAHPFALMHGDGSGARIFQLGNWGALAAYPPGELERVTAPKSRAVEDGPILILGHVSSTEQKRQGLVDVWHTPGGDKWLEEERAKPGRKFRPHPRMWREGERQATLAEDLKGCSRALAWNSTSVIHARLLGYPADTIEPHGWGRFTLERLAALRVLPAEVRSGEYWATTYRPWLLSLKEKRSTTA